MKVAIGCDPNATELKEVVKKHLESLGHEWEDLGSDDPIYADRGILLCGTGIGMSIAANKVPGITAALCADVYSTERSIKSNNAKIMTMGAFTTGRELAKSLVSTWMEAQYTPGTPSEPKVQRIDDYDKKHSKKD